MEGDKKMNYFTVFVKYFLSLVVGTDRKLLKVTRASTKMRENKEVSGPAGKGYDLEKLIVKYRPALKSFIKKRVSNEEDAEDILQDVFYKFIKAVENTLNPIEQVAAWLYRVARNTIINKGK
jgi:hypothetical protein